MTRPRSVLASSVLLGFTAGCSLSVGDLTLTAPKGEVGGQSGQSAGNGSTSIGGGTNATSGGSGQVGTGGKGADGAGGNAVNSGGSANPMGGGAGNPTTIGGAPVAGGAPTVGGSVYGGSTNGGTSNSGATNGGTTSNGGSNVGGKATGGVSTTGGVTSGVGGTTTGVGGEATGGSSPASGGLGTGGAALGGTPGTGGAGTGGATTPVCALGLVRSCDTHPGLDGKGICKAGSQTCVADSSSTKWGDCLGAVGPGIETCALDGKDEDCDGLFNEDAPCAPKYERISVGGFHTCGVVTNGEVKCWGRNEVGQLGMGLTNANANGKWAVAALGNVLDISAGYEHTCALHFDGTVSCWGYNNAGQLGNGNKNNSWSPVTVPGLTNVIAISAGMYHTCAVRSDYTAVCWGAGDYGVLGNGLTVGSLSPTPVLNLAGIVAISASAFNTCVLLNDSTMRCWGDDTRGEVGNGYSSTSEFLTPQSTGLTNVTSIDQNSARKNDGTLWFWGANEYGQAGTGEKVPGEPANIEYHSPIQVLGISNAASISRAGVATCAAMTDGTARCWGTNSSGSLGLGTNDNSFIPVAVPGLTGVSTLDCGSSGSCCAIITGGQLRCWGANGYSQAKGDGTAGAQLSPTVGPDPY